MNTVISLQQKLIDHLAEIDLNKLSICDLNGYASVINLLHNMTKPDYTDTLAKVLACNGFGASEKKEA